MSADPAEIENDTLPAALARHHILGLTPEQVEKLQRYCDRLWDWNRRLNLTRHTSYEKFVGRDVVDSVQIAHLLQPKERVIDVGTGGGLPGAIVAIIRPDVELFLCDSVAKKALAVEAIVREAEVPARTFHARAEELVGREHYDTLIIRAVAPLTKLLGWFKPHWKNIGQLLVIKGPQWVEERGLARHLGFFNDLQLRKAAAYPLAGTHSESVILEIKPKPKE